ncbi:MAG: response regulator transcription factor [Chromatiales bacterium]|jgi:DNA-binding NarL/FixJ family response regulator
MRILIVDDHTLFREAFILLLKEFDPALTVIEASSAEEALSALEYYPDLDLILLDNKLPGMDGLAALPLLRETAPTVPVVILSGTDDHSAVRSALAEGAVGFIHKSTGSQEMRNALQLVMQGEVYAPLAMLSTRDSSQPAKSIHQQTTESSLTQRQLEVLQLLSEGRPNKTIARQLGITEATVKLHVSAILQALRVRNRTEAVLEATRRRLLLSA